MAKRNTALMNRQVVYKPVRLISRRTILKGLLEEIRYSSSEGRLYASMLAQVIVNEEPTLKRDFAHLLD